MPFPCPWPLVPLPSSDPGWTRTIVAWMWARSLRRWTTGSISVAEVGIEPTNSHQAIDLAALPICVLGRVRILNKESRNQGTKVSLPVFLPSLFIPHPSSLILSVAEAGFEPESKGFRNRAGNQTPVHSAVTKGRVELPCL